LRHVPAPPAEIGYEPEIFVLGAPRKRPERLGGLGGEVFDAEDELGVGDGGAGFCGGDCAVEGGQGGDGLLAVDVVY